MIQPCVLNLRRGWWAIDFQVPKESLFCFVQIEFNFILGNRFSLFDSKIFFHPLYFSLFYRSFHVFLTIAIRIYLCFAGEVLFRFLAFGFISQTTRISNKTSFLCKRLIVKKIILETIFQLKRRVYTNRTVFLNFKLIRGGKSSLFDNSTLCA